MTPASTSPFVALGFSILFAWTPCTAQSKLTFRTRDVKLPAQATSCVVQDLTGDGTADVFLALGRSWWLFTGTSRDLEPIDSGPRPFPPEAVCFDIGRAGDETLARLVVLTPETLLEVPLKDVSPEQDLQPAPLLNKITALLGPDPGCVSRARLFQDLEGNGRSQLLVPGLNGIHLYQYLDPGEVELHHSLSFPLDALHHISGGAPFDCIESEVTYPDIATGDVNGDGLPDITLIQNHFLTFFFRNQEGRFSPRPLARFPLPFRKTGTRLLDIRIAPRLVDLNGDGILDLVDVDAHAGRIQIHSGPLDKPEARRPTTVLRTSQILLQVTLLDLNRDGLPDLRVTTTETVGLLNGVRIFLTQTMPVRMLTFLQRRKDMFHSRADHLHDLRIPVAVETAGQAPKIRPVSLFLQDRDLDGDHVPDLLVRSSRRELAFHPGLKASGGISRRPGIRIPMARTPGISWTDLRSGDFNGDGRSDLLLLGRIRGGGAGQMRIFLSTP